MLQGRLTNKTERFSFVWKMAHSEESVRPRTPGQTRTPKRRQILVGARALFSEVGFERACVDEIAARAGVSKATVYSHFHDKKALYAAYLSEEVDSLRESVRCMLLSAEPVGDIGVALREAGERLLALFLDPAIVNFYRNASAEIERFPELGQTLFDSGPAAMISVIGTYLSRWHERGALRLDDPHTAAIHFVMLCHGDLVARSQLGVLPDPLQPAIAETVRKAVDAFLLAYGTRTINRPGRSADR
jgi:TetR/AcrR family transcriptional repressor of mexJK operon